MIYIIIKWFVNALALYLVTMIIPGVSVANFSSALVAAIVIGLVNALIQPFFVLITLPINILTLGLFTFVINAIMLQIAAWIAPGFMVRDFWSALLGSILLSIISSVLHTLLT